MKALLLMTLLLLLTACQPYHATDSDEAITMANATVLTLKKIVNNETQEQLIQDGHSLDSTMFAAYDEKKHLYNPYYFFNIHTIKDIDFVEVYFNTDNLVLKRNDCSENFCQFNLSQQLIHNVDNYYSLLHNADCNSDLEFSMDDLYWKLINGKYTIKAAFKDKTHVTKTFYINDCAF